MHLALLLLRNIPKGKVTTYGELARATGSSARAIGSVMRSNKQPALYPCYKVVCSSGALGGYCGKTDGPNIKKKIALLERDGVVVRNNMVDLSLFFFGFYSVAMKRKI
ncbi:MAG: MGMT family protein [Candidatus Aenigmarchaeota archaeon]|nr:MGMT family protein [Candidatus Aenigmarchaeota archaeon]